LTLKIATWNVNSLRVRLDHVRSWIESERPDVLALQETKVRDEDFPSAELEALGYSAVFSGQPTYNGVALITRGEAREVATDIEGFEDAERRVLSATVGDLRIVNLYVPNGQRVDSDKYRYKLRWLAALEAQLARELGRHDRCVVLGDFNIAPEDRDVHDPAAWEGKVLCSEPERRALAGIRGVGFDDLFRRFEQPEKSFSWWDYRAGAFRRNVGLRIDLILGTRAVSRDCRCCFIDKTPRKLERPSDHAPVVAVLEPG
jgi:exodeoxyribonuclease III